MRMILFVAVVAAAADAPEPLVRPIVPASNRVSVRVPIHTDNSYTGSQIKLRVPRAGANDATVAATAAFDTLRGKGFVSEKAWKSWGYEVPDNRVGILPELVIPATQLAPKLPKGRDVEVKFAAVALEIIAPPGESGLIYGSDLYLRLSDLTKNADRLHQPRFHFGDEWLELAVPRAAVTRLDTGDGDAPAPATSRDATLVPVAGPMVIRGAPVFAFASINGVSRYKLADGKLQTVDVGVSSNANLPGGILMTIGVARGCNVDFGEEGKGVGAGFETTIAKGKVKEFRLACRRGMGFKEANDLVLKDATVYVDKANSGHFVWLGSKFVAAHLADGVYACGTDGAWRLLGRVKPELLADVKTRAAEK